MPYLTAAEVSTTVAALAVCSAPTSRLVVNFQLPGTSLTLGRLVARLLMASTGRRSFWATEPWRSTWTPAAVTALLTRHGFTVTGDHDLLDTARALGLPIRRATSLAHSRVLVAERA
ncbi:hypothetical protein [Micromonospora sp. NPDC049102]|uniref:hypothetical protein n=1 Tax=Micromonospora sp. NPDC049102 TaxID=3364265 RepID=UPI00371D53C4